MQFYKIRSELIELPTDGEEKKNIRELAREIAVHTMDFSGNDESRFCFVVGIDTSYVTFGVIESTLSDTASLVEGLADYLGLKIGIFPPEEITFAAMRGLLTTADRLSFIEDKNEILIRFGLDKVSGRYMHGIEFGENLTSINMEKDKLIEVAKRCCVTETLIPEIERIYQGKARKRSMGHPVHYLVEMDDVNVRREAVRAILDGLYSNFRLDIRRYTYVDFIPGEEYSLMAYESLYRVSEGGAILVRYMSDVIDGEDDSASSDTELIMGICEMARKYRNKVLTVLCLPRECKRVKKLFYENLGNMAFIELREDLIDFERAKIYLTSLAKKQHVRTDKRLFESLNADAVYLSGELTNMFDTWYDRKLKTVVYPQYKDVSAARKTEVTAKPDGTAYDELGEMIGLAEAKAVIDKALNFYKMQKLCTQNGIRRSDPAMHMVFSGNPGTAKTTVARLFARIMRENGLLSSGHLVEVGRCDLVGKYMGWTAQIVKAKFKEAIGGVLFVDEAYSLVDDRNGAYGDEAINTIVQEMENHRTDMVVIFAGYPDKMESFLKKNPGLRSRVAFHVPFADYDSRELSLIADMMVRKHGMKMDASAAEKLIRAFDIARTSPDFGNGRYVRNVFEDARMNQASRLLKKDIDTITKDDITTITAEDIVLPEVKTAEKRRIGFC